MPVLFGWRRALPLAVVVLLAFVGSADAAKPGGAVPATYSTLLSLTAGQQVIVETFTGYYLYVHCDADVANNTEWAAFGIASTDDSRKYGIVELVGRSGGAANAAVTQLGETDQQGNVAGGWGFNPYDYARLTLTVARLGIDTKPRTITVTTRAGCSFITYTRS